MLRKLALLPLTIVLALTATGWLYLVRPVGGPGPQVREALPLDELAGRSGAPFLWFAAVWLGVGVLLAFAARWARLESLWAALVAALLTLGLVFAATATSVAVTRQVPDGHALHAATRLEAVYLPAALIGIVLAAATRPRPHRRRLPLLLALCLAAAACLDLLHHVLPGYRRGLWYSLTPDAIGSLAAAAGVCAGLALLVAARGLARRRRRAWELAVALSALSMALDVLRAAGPAGFVSGLMLILLLACRRDFVQPGDVETRFVPARRSVLALAAIASYSFAVLWTYRLDANRPFSLGFAAGELFHAMLGLRLRHVAGLGNFGPWFSGSLLVLGGGATAWIVGGWFAPWHHRVRQGVRERSEVRSLVHAFGDDTLAPFALRRDKAYFFAADHRAFLAYRVVRGVAIVSGDPVGSTGSFGSLVASFVDHAHERDWRVAILGASERWLHLSE